MESEYSKAYQEGRHDARKEILQELVDGLAVADSYEQKEIRYYILSLGRRLGLNPERGYNGYT